MRRHPREKLVRGVRLVTHLSRRAPGLPAVAGHGEANVRVRARHIEVPDVLARAVGNVGPGDEDRPVRSDRGGREAVAQDAQKGLHAVVGSVVLDEDKPGTRQTRRDRRGRSPGEPPVLRFREQDIQRPGMEEIICVEHVDRAVRRDDRERPSGVRGLRISWRTDGQPRAPGLSPIDGPRHHDADVAPSGRADEVGPGHIDRSPELALRPGVDGDIVLVGDVEDGGVIRPPAHEREERERPSAVGRSGHDHVGPGEIAPGLDVKVGVIEIAVGIGCDGRVRRCLAGTFQRRRTAKGPCLAAIGAGREGHCTLPGLVVDVPFHDVPGIVRIDRNRRFMLILPHRIPPAGQIDVRPEAHGDRCRDRPGTRNQWHREHD